MVMKELLELKQGKSVSEFNKKFNRLVYQINNRQVVLTDTALILMYKNKLQPWVFNDVAHMDEPLWDTQDRASLNTCPADYGLFCPDQDTRNDSVTYAQNNRSVGSRSFRPETNRPRQGQTRRLCFNCNQPGHIANECPQAPRPS